MTPYRIVRHSGRSAGGDDGLDSPPSVREVQIRALSRETPWVVGSICDGERSVITRHGEPLAVLLSVRDAIELFLVAGGGLEEIVDTGWREFRRGLATEPWPHLTRRRLCFSCRAMARYNRLGPRDRGQLRRSLLRASMPAPGDARLSWIDSGIVLALFSASPGSRLIVHALLDGRRFERRLIGAELAQKRLRIALDRHTHGRAQAAPSGLMRGPRGRG